MRTSRLLLQDILDAIAEIERYTPNTLEKFNAEDAETTTFHRKAAVLFVNRFFRVCLPMVSPISK
jgi:uncharacterized protein with HEPN domain